MFTPDALGQLVSDKSGRKSYEGRIVSMNHETERYQVAWRITPLSQSPRYRKTWMHHSRVEFQPAFIAYMQDKYVHLSGASSNHKNK